MKRNKGFTLIELLVTISVIAVLVLLAAPKLLGYTDKAKVSELTTNTRSIQDAAERYYFAHDESEWPRLTDEPYTDDEVQAFAEKIYDLTGEEVSLDPDGNYYDIDFDKLKPFIDVPGEKANYILQNPVGKVYSLYKPTSEALERLPETAQIEEEIDMSEGEEISCGAKEFKTNDGVVVTSSAPVYCNQDFYKMSNLFDGFLSEAGPSTWGVPDNYWLTSSTGNQTLTFDFNKPAFISKIDVSPRTRNDHFSDFRILASNDNVNWNVLTEWFITDINTPYNHTESYEINETYQYYRLELTRKGYWGVSLAEIKFYK